MVEINQFGSAQPGSPQVCGRCESLLMDILDGIASTEDQAFFDQHVASCTGCSQMLADARRGGAWLEMLRDPRPEPPAALFERILAQTSGLVAATPLASSQSSTVAASFGPRITPPIAQEAATTSPSAGATAAYPFATPNEPRYSGGLKVLTFRVREAIHGMGQAMLQPRLAMTAAMAFFSIALTLNLTGVHLSELRASDLKPANIRRGFHEANAHVVRYCDNLRVVYELEARAHDLQRNSESDSQSAAPTTHDDAPANAPKQGSDPNHPGDQQKASPRPGPGTSRREPLTRDDRQVATLSAPGSVANKLKSVPTAHLKGDQA
jgi:hypothetical protein